MTIRLLLADDHEIVRQGFRSLLAAQDGFTVVAETGDGAEAVALVAEHRPDVLVLDVSLPSLDGIEVARRARLASPETAVVMLSMHAHEAYVAQAVRSGATAYVLKESSVTDLVAAIRAAHAGERFFSTGVADPAGRPADPGPSDRYDTLTPREREIAHLVAEGLTAPAIAERLFISARTVETHRGNAMAKLGARSQADLVRYIVERHLGPRSF